MRRYHIYYQVVGTIYINHPRGHLTAYGNSAGGAGFAERTSLTESS